MTTSIKIDRVGRSDLERVARGETPAGASLWVMQVTAALAADDRGEAHDAILASAPLTESDVEWLETLVDDSEIGNHPHVDLAYADEDEEVLDVALHQILRARTEEILASPWAADWRDRLNPRAPPRAPQTEGERR